MKIDLTALLRKAGNEADIEEVAQVDYAADGLTLTGPSKVRFHLVNTGPSVLLDGTVETEAELECSRCGQKFNQPLAVEIAEEYTKSPPPIDQKKGKEIELKEEDFVYPIAPDNSLDLGETIRQNLLLALPLQTICGQCKGPR